MDDFPVQLYIRLFPGKDVDFLVLKLSSHWCLSETKTLVHLLNPRVKKLHIQDPQGNLWELG